METTNNKSYQVIKKVAIISRTLLSGGAEKQSVYLAKALSMNFRVSLIVLKGNCIEQKFLEIIKKDGINVIRLKGSLIQNIIDVFKIFRKEKIDISFSYLASGNFVNSVAGLLARIPHRIGGIRNAELSHNKTPFEKFFHNYLLTKTISNSYAAVSGLSKLGFIENKFHVIHNAFDLKQSFILRNEKDVVNIVSVARFVPQKDFFTALESINLLRKQLKKKGNKFKYYLIGYGQQENEIRDKVKELQLGEQVQIIIKPDNLNDYYKDADIFLSTSLFEGLSNSVMEALSFSLPIVGTKAGDIEYLVKEGENGYLCEISNPKAIAEKLQLLINNYELRRKMGLKSYQIISEDFTFDKFKHNYISFINKLYEK